VTLLAKSFLLTQKLLFKRMKTKIDKKTVLVACIFVVSFIVLFSKLMLPTTIQIFLEGEDTQISEVPNLYTFSDVVIILISSIFLTASAAYLLVPIPLSESEKRKIRDEVCKRLSGEAKGIYSILMESKGVMFQSELVERSGLPKASVSLILSRLEAEGLIEKKRHGMSNLIVLK